MHKPFFISFVVLLVVTVFFGWLAAVVAAAVAYYVQGWLERRQPVAGALFITGCDSGMGENAAVYFAKKGFRVYAGVFLEGSKGKLKDAAGDAAGNLVTVPLDVTSEESVKAAAKTVEKDLHANSMELFGLINCAGVGFTGPAEYFPKDMYRRQMDVNFFGYVATTQAFLPLIRRATADPQNRRGRVIFVGTGGGVLTPAPPLLTAYMASKWAGEAFCQGLRFEMQLTKQRIDALMINPGFVKPTGLMAGGKELLERAWKEMPPQAKDEYGHLVDKFLKFSEEQPGAEPIHVSQAMDEALAAEYPKNSYKVGYDSHASPFVGMLPTFLREFIVRKSMYG